MKRIRRRRLSKTEIEALSNRRDGAPLSSTQRGALRRLDRSGLPSREDVASLAAQEATALEWKTRRAEDVHEPAVWAHLEEMGPYRAEALVRQLEQVDWDSRKPIRLRIAPGSRGRPWAINVIRSIERLRGTRKDEWVSMGDLASDLKWPPAVRGRKIHRLEKERVLEISHDGNLVKLAPLESRIEAMLKNDRSYAKLPESLRQGVADLLRTVEERGLVAHDLRLPRDRSD